MRPLLLLVLSAACTLLSGCFISPCSGCSSQTPEGVAPIAIRNSTHQE